jgi:hypothetical protein
LYNCCQKRQNEKRAKKQKAKILWIYEIFSLILLLVLFEIARETRFIDMYDEDERSRWLLMQELSGF